MLWLSTVDTPRPETEETVETVETVVVGLFVVCHIEHRTVCCRSSPSSVCLFPLFLVFHCGFAFVQSTALRKKGRGQGGVVAKRSQFEY